RSGLVLRGRQQGQGADGGLGRAPHRHRVDRVRGPGQARHRPWGGGVVSVTTKTYREKANQTEFVAVVRYYVEVAPGERYDVHFQWGSGDDTVSVYARDASDIETFPSPRAAEKWVRNRLKAQLTKGTHIAGAEVTEYFYKVVTTHDDP